MMKMHEQAQRLYEAARRTNRLNPKAEQTSLAQLLNVAVQNVNNWSRRGVSKDAAIEAQRILGISATWILDGVEPVFLAGQEPPITYTDNSQAQAVDEKRLLDTWRSSRNEAREVARFALSKPNAPIPAWADNSTRRDMDSMLYKALLWLREGEQPQVQVQAPAPEWENKKTGT